MANKLDRLKFLTKKNFEEIELKGYTAVKNFFSENEIYEYKKYILTQFKSRKWYQGKTFGPNYKNYCTYWLFDKLKFISARLYIQEHSRPEFLSKRINSLKEDMITIEHVINKKNGIQSEEERIFFDIVSIYIDNSSGYPPHRDSKPGNLELQAQHTITLRNYDFNGGDLILHKDKKKIKTSKDLNITNRDLILFDKSITHSVEPIKPAFTGLGRWMTLYNASINKQKKQVKEKKKLKSFIRDSISKVKINKLRKLL